MSNTYSNGPGNVPRLPDRVVDTLIDSAGVSRCAPGRGITVIDQTAAIEALVHGVCEELLARLPAPADPEQAKLDSRAQAGLAAALESHSRQPQAAPEVSRLYSWLVRASTCGVPDVESAARTMKDYYEGADSIAIQAAPEATTFQSRVQPWMMACFGQEIAADCVERNHRFLEESLELVQACGCTEDEARQLVAYVYGRPVGEKPQEVGGVMVTLAALCLAQGIDMHTAGETELERIWTKVESIRAKQAAKPKHSPLPEATSEQMGGAQVATLSCPQCGVDRLKEPCPGTGDDCAMVADAHLLATTESTAAPEGLPGAHHLAPENVAAVIKDLREIEDGTTERPIEGRDWRTWAGVLARIIDHLATSRAAEGEATERKPLTIVEAKAEAAAPEAPDDAQGTPYFRDVEFDPPSGLFTTITSLDRGIGSGK